jgi:hypothetical protein
MLMVLDAHLQFLPFFSFRLSLPRSLFCLILPDRSDIVIKEEARKGKTTWDIKTIKHPTWHRIVTASPSFASLFHDSTS